MIRHEILEGCKIVFSHLFPKICPPTNQPLWKMAVELGAICTMNVDSSVTHVVAGDRGTDKARWALRENKFLVNPGWIEAANYLWRRHPEKDFAVAHSKG